MFLYTFIPIYVKLMYVNEVKGQRSLARSNVAVVYSCCYFLVFRIIAVWCGLNKHGEKIRTVYCCICRFKAKYHPEECDKRKADHRAALKRRADIFHRLMQLNYVENVTADLDKYDGLVRLLDAGKCYVSLLM